MQTIDFSDLTDEEKELFRKRDVINTLPNLKKMVRNIFGMAPTAEDRQKDAADAAAAAAVTSAVAARTGGAVLTQQVAESSARPTTSDGAAAPPRGSSAVRVLPVTD